MGFNLGTRSLMASLCRPPGKKSAMTSFSLTVSAAVVIDFLPALAYS